MEYLLDVSRTENRLRNRFSDIDISTKIKKVNHGSENVNMINIKSSYIIHIHSLSLYI